jgi:hypothetical protein
LFSGENNLTWLLSDLQRLQIWSELTFISNLLSLQTE